MKKCCRERLFFCRDSVDVVTAVPAVGLNPSDKLFPSWFCLWISSCQLSFLYIDDNSWNGAGRVK